jgi:hypothetical protein
MLDELKVQSRDSNLRGAAAVSPICSSIDHPAAAVRVDRSSESAARVAATFPATLDSGRPFWRRQSLLCSAGLTPAYYGQLVRHGEVRPWKPAVHG